MLRAVLAALLCAPLAAALTGAPSGAATSTLVPTFTASPTTAYAGETVQFTDTTLAAHTAPAWDFNADGKADAAGPSAHTSFAEPGTYAVSLQVTDPSDQVVRATHKIEVIGKPDVSITADNTTPFAGQLVALSAQTSGDIKVISWDLNGDGTYDDATGPTASARFHQGSAVVGVQVTDVRGSIASGKLDLSVGPPQNPTSVITAPAVTAGRYASISGALSTAASDARIVNYQWSLAATGRFHISTGANPVFRHQFAPGTTTLRLRTVDSNGNTATSFTTIHTTPGGCTTSTMHVGRFNATAACVHQDGSVYTLTPAPEPGGHYAVNLDGVTIRMQSSDRLRINTDTLHVWTHGGVAFVLENTPIGDIYLWGSGDQPLDITTAAGTSGVVGLMSVAAGSNCPSTAGTVCARLPGNFPLTGRLDLSIDTSNDDIVIDANVGLTRPINITARVRIRADLLNGIYLDQLGFRVQDATFGPIKLKNLQFSYEAPGTGDPVHDGDLWDVQVEVEITNGFDVQGELKFVDGAFNYGAASVTLPDGVGVPIFPGVLLNHIGAQFGVDPEHLEGEIGAKVVAILQVNAAVMFEQDGDVTHWHIDGEGDLNDQPLAHVTFDYYSDGFISLTANLTWQTPYPSDSPAFFVGGGVTFWLETESDGSVRFQGTGQVGLKIGPIGPIQAQVLVNNTWIAGCIGGGTFGLHGAYNIPRAYFDGGLGCDLTSYSIDPLNHTVSSSTAAGRLAANAAPAGTATFTVPSGLTGVDLQFTGSGAVPDVTVIAPNGTTYAPTTSDAVARHTSWATVAFPSENQTVLAVRRPAAGTWQVVPNAGSVPIAHLRLAKMLPTATVTASVSGTGHRRTLTWSAHQLSGKSIRFVEKGSGGSATILNTTKARGSYTFTPAPGPSGTRGVFAYLYSGAMPEHAIKLTTYRAPGPSRPGRPGLIHFKRSGLTMHVSFGAATGRPQGYVVTVRGTDGRRERHVLPASVRTFTINTLHRNAGVTVTVWAYRFSPAFTGPYRRAVHRAG
jgi:hypothetical protein